MTDSPKKVGGAYRRASQKARQLFEATEVLRQQAECHRLGELYATPPELEKVMDALQVVLPELDSSEGRGKGPSIRRPPGRPRNTLKANEAVRLKDEGLSYEQIATQLNQTLGQGAATRESTRMMIRRRKSEHSADGPDKIRD